jgi:hypothetical protein
MRTLFILILLTHLFFPITAQTVFKFEFTGYAGSAPPIAASLGSATLTQSGLSNFAEDHCTGDGFSVNSWDTNDYIQIQSSTTNYIGPFTFSFDYRMSDINLGNFVIQVSTDGNSFNTIGNLNATAPSATCNFLGPFSLSTSYNNQPNIYFRFLKTNDAATALNRLRLDNITLQATAVPVEISYFQTEVADFQKVNIRWETISEINSSYFVVERSRDAVNYKPIGSIEAAGSSRTKKTYSFTDETALFGTNYYRLKQIDSDGSQQIFRPQSVIIEDTYLPFGIFPNPLMGQDFSVKVEDSDEAEITLLDFSGKAIELKINKLTQTVVEISPLETLNFGTYILEVKTLGSLKKHKILVLK